MNLGHIVVALSLALGSSALAQAAPSFRTVSSETFAASQGETTLVDVREPQEWAATGVPADATPISISRSDFVDAVLTELGGDRAKPVAVICRTGARSARAAEQLAAAGFTNVINVGDGMMGREGVGQGWLASGLPTQPRDPNDE
jgi:rhodanese-related sulfurtransferase